MSEFNKNQYESETKQRWGNTEAYRESQINTAGYSKERWNNVAAGMNDIFSEFASCMNDGESADSNIAQGIVKRLQDYITANFYNCTDEILAGLGQMYVADDRFRSNIDKSGEGMAEFVSAAIRAYVGASDEGK